MVKLLVFGSCDNSVREKDGCHRKRGNAGDFSPIGLSHCSDLRTAVSFERMHTLVCEEKN